MTFKQAIIRNSLDLLAAEHHDALCKKPPQGTSIENKANKNSFGVLTPLAERAYVADVKSKVFSAEEVIERLQKMQGDKSLRAFADEIGITPAYLCDLYKGRRNPGDKVLSHLGLAKRPMPEPTYELA